MAIKKIEIRPKGSGDYGDVLYPKTSTDMVVDIATGQTVAEHFVDEMNPHNVTKAQLGLGNVDNVQQIPLSQKGVANGVASLDSGGDIPASQLGNLPTPEVIDQSGLINDNGSQWSGTHLTMTLMGTSLIKPNGQLEKRKWKIEQLGWSLACGTTNGNVSAGKASYQINNGPEIFLPQKQITDSQWVIFYENVPLELGPEDTLTMRGYGYRVSGSYGTQVGRFKVLGKILLIGE